MEIQLVGMQPNFGSTHLSRTYIPIPPINEQKRIVKKVDQLMKLCEKLKEEVERNQRKAEILMEVVLNESFSA